MQEWVKPSTDVMDTGSKGTPSGERPGPPDLPSQSLESRRRVQASPQVSQADTLQLTTDVAKLCLEGTRTLRQHTAALQHTMILPSDHHVVLAMQATGARYASQMAHTAQSTMPGAPHHRVWGSLVCAIIKAEETGQYPRTPIQDNTLVTIKDHAQSVKDPIDLQGLIHVCRVGTSFVKGKSKVCISATGTMAPIVSAVLQLLVHQGGDLKHGPPPRGPTERKVEVTLKKMGLWQTQPGT